MAELELGDGGNCCSNVPITLVPYRSSFGNTRRLQICSCTFVKAWLWVIRVIKLISNVVPLDWWHTRNKPIYCPALWKVWVYKAIFNQMSGKNGNTFEFLWKRHFLGHCGHLAVSRWGMWGEFSTFQLHILTSQLPTGTKCRHAPAVPPSSLPPSHNLVFTEKKTGGVGWTGAIIFPSR